jgi:AraC-like DNA-binding protein
MKNTFIFVPGRKAPELGCFPHIRMFGNQRKQRLERGFLKQHRHPALELCFVWDGRYEWTVDGRLIRLNPGDASLTCPWQTHGGSNDAMNIGTLSWIIIKPRRFTPDGTLRLGPWSALQAHEEKEIGRILARNRRPVLPRLALGGLFIQLHHELTHREAGWETRANYLLCDMLLLAARRLARPPAQDRNVPDNLRRIMREIDSDLPRPWTVEELTRAAGLGVTAFIRQFKQATGLTPRRYIIDRRVARARELLASSRLTITDIALELGFSSSQHFANTFRKHLGAPPRDFRRP